jgi:hypothetical protein
LALILLLGPAAAASDSDSTAAVRAIKALERSAAALSTSVPASTSGISRDVGHIAIIEHDGAGYDRNLPDGTPNYDARAPVASTRRTATTTTSWSSSRTSSSTPAAPLRSTT